MTFKRQREDNKEVSPIKRMNTGGLPAKGSLNLLILLPLFASTLALTPLQFSTPSPNKLSPKPKVIPRLKPRLKPYLLPRY